MPYNFLWAYVNLVCTNNNIIKTISQNKFHEGLDYSTNDAGEFTNKQNPILESPKLGQINSTCIKFLNRAIEDK